MTSQPFNWRPLAGNAQNRVAAVLSSWEGTFYLPQHRIKGMGVDCYQIVAAFLDEMFRCPAGTTVLPKLSPNIARHRPDLARSAIRVLRKAHLGSTRVTDRTVEPGDIVVVRSILQTDGPAFEGHTLIVGSVPGTMLHAIRPRVVFGSLEGRDVVAVYRSKGKEQWC